MKTKQKTDSSTDQALARPGTAKGKKDISKDKILAEKDEVKKAEEKLGKIRKGTDNE